MDGNRVKLRKRFFDASVTTIVVEHRDRLARFGVEHACRCRCESCAGGWVSTVVQAYRFALDPTPGQDTALRSHCGGQRFAYNWGLARVKATLAQREAERSYGIDGQHLTPSLSWSAYSLRKTWNRAKEQGSAVVGENSKEAYWSGLANLATALGNWGDSRTGKRRGPKVRFPRFKGIVEEGTPDTVFDHPTHPRLQRFLSQVR